MGNPSRWVYFRCDADAAVGMGHASRCVTLAEAALRRGHQARFIMRANHTEGQSLVRARGFDVELLPEDCALEREADHYSAEARLVVLDLCHAMIMGEPSKLHPLIQELKSMHSGVVVIDAMEEHAFRLPCTPEPDVVITPYLGAEHQTRPACRRWLAGASYAILPDGYDKPRPPRAHVGELTQVLVSMGGSDPFGMTERVLQIFQKVNAGPFVCRVVIGPFFSEEYVHKLQATYGNGLRGAQIEWVHSAHSLIEHYYWADLVIGAAGLMRYEVGALGLASLLIVPHDCYRTYLEQFNRKRIARILFAQDVGFDDRLLREATLLISSPQARAALGGGGPRLINAFGKDIVVTTIVDACAQVAGPEG